MFGKLSKRDLKQWQKLVIHGNMPRQYTEDELKQLSAPLIHNSVRIINESLAILRNTTNEETRKGRLSLIQREHTFLNTFRPYWKEPFDYPRQAVENIIRNRK